MLVLERYVAFAIRKTETFNSQLRLWKIAECTWFPSFLKKDIYIILASAFRGWMYRTVHPPWYSVISSTDTHVRYHNLDRLSIFTNAINEKSINCWRPISSRLPRAAILYKRNPFVRIYETTFMPPYLVFPRVNSVINIRRCLYSDNRYPLLTYMCLLGMLHMCRAHVHGIFQCQWTWMANWNCVPRNRQI